MSPKNNTKKATTSGNAVQSLIDNISQSLEAVSLRLDNLKSKAADISDETPSLDGQAFIISPTGQGPGRFNTCAMCGGRDYRGTVALATGEYIASGMTPSYLKGLNQVDVIINGQQQRVTGAWLHAEVSTRRPLANGMRERATSLPGFLCGEPSSAHHSVSLVSPLLRRATEDEEMVQRVTRVANWTDHLNPADVMSHAAKSAAGGVQRLIKSAQTLGRFAQAIVSTGIPARASARVGPRASRV